MQLRVKDKICISIIVLVFLIGTLLWLNDRNIRSENQTSNDSSDFQVRRIAHAGGGINNDKYTNSIEALDYNLKNGFLYFELDFTFTADEKLACIHTWNASNHFDNKFEEAPTLEEFESILKNSSKYTNCTIYSLADWMERNPSAIIITDVKGNNLKALKIISEVVNGFEKRVVPQMYKPNNYEEIKRMGYENIIWTLYRYGGSDEEVLESASELNNLAAITMNRKRANSGLPIKLKEIGIPIYMHTINSEEERLSLKDKYGIAEIYTDFLTPSK